MLFADLVLSVAPVLLLILLMIQKSPMPSAKALPLAAVVACCIRLVWFGDSAQVLTAAVVAGLLTALTPISIVYGAIFLFRTMKRAVPWRRSVTG